MTAVYVVMGALALIAAGCCLPIGGGAVYDGEGLRAWLRVGPARMTLWPRPERPPKKAKPPREKKRAPEGKRSSLPGGSVAVFRELLPPALEAAGKLGRSLRVDELEMVLTVAMPDPADAAMCYARASALLGALWQPLTRALSVRDGRARIDLDLEAVQTTVKLRAELSVRAGAAAAAGAVFALKALGSFLRLRRAKRAE